MRSLFVVMALVPAIVSGTVPGGVVSVRADSAESRTGDGQVSGTDALSRQWRRIPSTHFTAVGDAPESVLRDALRELEIFRTAVSALAPVLPAPRYPASTPLVVVFRDDSTFEPYKPRDINGRRRSNVGGYYFDDPQGAYIVTAANGQTWGPRSTVVLHEYAHEVFHFTLGTGLPPWLDEGLAELCASVGLDARSQPTGRWLGRPMASHIAALRSRPGPSVTALLATDHAALTQLPPDDAALFYAKSWALVHYLLLGRSDRKPEDVPSFLAAVASGRPATDAFESAFRVELSDVDAALTSYALRSVLPAVPVVTPPPSGADSDVDRMLQSEVDRIQGNLLLQVRDLPGASDRLGSAFTLNPESVDARLSLARLRTIDLRPEEALDLLSPYVTDRPATYATQLILGRARQRSGRCAGALDAFALATTLAEPGLEAWYGMSLTALMCGRADTAADAMSRLQSLDPAPAWYFERARDLWEAGRDDLVVSDIQMLLNVAVSDVQGRAYAAFIGTLSARRLAQTTTADQMLTRVASTELGRWPTALLAFLQGRLTARELLGQTRGAGQETEAHTYIGITASVAGRTDDARHHLAWVRDRGVRTYAEYDMSRVELARLE